VSVAAAQQPPRNIPDPIVKENVTVKLATHSYLIPDGNAVLVPNIGIVVGDNATLVVDTGMGPRNGAAVMREVAKVSKNTKLYLVTTHYHAEHVAGIAAFLEGRFRDAIPLLTESEHQMRTRCVGVSWEIGSLLTFQLWSWWWLGIIKMRSGPSSMDDRQVWCCCSRRTWTQRPGFFYRLPSSWRVIQRQR